MLHEILLSLSGHPSPLFPATLEKHTAANVGQGQFPDLTASEVALLDSVGRLALLHRKIRAQAQYIVSEHPSIICRAVASSILGTHLDRFQKKVLEVENHILNRDAKLVGAYNIVPLSAVVGEFDEWRRRMEWYWRVACYIQDPAGPSAVAPRTTGAVLMDHLRAESQTGFPDIEAVSIELSRVAEKAWLKQVSVWLLYGRIPSHGSGDFFVSVKESADLDGLDAYHSSHTLLPRFVSNATAGSLMFIGKSLHQVKRHRKGSFQLSAAESAAEAQLLSEHLGMLSSLTLPLVPTTFSTTISRIRSSLSQKVLQKLLPIEDIEVSLNTLRQFFLLERGEFATSLIWEAQAQLNTRQGDLGRFQHEDPARNLQGVLIKEGEVNETLLRTWKVLNTAQAEDIEDDVLDFAQEHLRLEIKKRTESQPSSTLDHQGVGMPGLAEVEFDDLLFPVQTSLTMHIRSPLDLFISRYDVERYAKINAYLTALRRAHTRLSDLWRLSPMRREDPKASASARARLRSRVAGMRKVWATCSAAVFLLSETTAYFEGAVIKGSWDHFFAWVVGGTGTTAHDPETLSSAHRLFFSSLSYALLLTDVKYTKTVRTLLSNVDHLVGHFTHLQQIQRSLDLDAESGIVSKYAVEEEQSIALELDRARKRVDSGMKDVVGRLRQLDSERLGDGMFRGLKIAADGGDEGRTFEAWRGGGVERLLMKLDFGRVSEDETMFI